MKRIRIPEVGAIITVFVVIAGLPWLAGDYMVSFVFSLMMWLALTQSWVVFSGLTGYISLGHAVFFGAGAYVMVLCWGTISFWLAIPLAGIVAGTLAFLLGYPCLRVRGPYFVILTFGLAELIKFVVVNIESALGQFSRVVFGGPGIEQLFHVMVGLAAIATLMTYFVRRSRAGVGLRAIRENEEAAQTIGIAVAQYKAFAFALSAIIPGMVGAVMVLRTTYFEPLQVFSPITSFTIVSIAIIGGGDDAPGPVYGALFLVVLQELLWANWPQLYMIILGLMLVFFVLWSPDGVDGWVRKWQLLRRK
ncbi:MAG: branched-chain amino acid ABC transporter permease [Alphaproteobacteria bacterium]|nr:branched-chain amino acid ABC transporter permease [Alphaproteobacteria bacterium]